MGQLGHVASLGLFVCALDRPQEGVIAALTTRGGCRLGGDIGRQGLRGRGRAGRDLRLAAPEQHDVELLGQRLPAGRSTRAFDVLFSNQDSIRMAANLHGDMIRVAVENSMRIPGALTVLGTPIDLRPPMSQPTSWPVETDHVTMAPNAYRGTQIPGRNAPTSSW